MFSRFLAAVLLVTVLTPFSKAADPTPPEHKLHVVLVGDSTVATTSGWGPAFARQFGPDTECTDTARGGQSSKSFLDQGLWQRALALKPDWVLIQFGHNDQPGKGPNRETDPETTYRANMTRFIEEARAAGVKPILITSMTRRNFKDGHIVSNLTPYVDVVKNLAAEKQVPLVDLHARSIALLEKMGPEAAAVMDPPGVKPNTSDHTHLNERGAELIAALIVEDVRKVAPELATHFLPAPSVPQP
jgi:lysophospholipase L1-like esterase